MGVARFAGGLLAIALLAGWNRFVSGLVGADEGLEAHGDGPTPDGTVEGTITEHRRNWYDYIRGFHVHHGDVDADGDEPEHGDFGEGLDRWLDSGCLRGYTLGDHTYVCSNAPRVLRVHQAGHTPTFGRQFEPLRAERRPDGGLPDEPLRTLDVMLPGAFPHTMLRLRDPRGLGPTYDEWVREGRLERV